VAKYTREDFKIGAAKVLGLAVHNAKQRHELAIDYADRDPVLAYEGKKWVAWGVLPHLTVANIGSADRAADFARIASSDNLKLLADRYGFIGFVTCEPRRKGRGFEYLTVSLYSGKQKGGSK
jgi:hypothetical protein